MLSLLWGGRRSPNGVSLCFCLSIASFSGTDQNKCPLAGWFEAEQVICLGNVFVTWENLLLSHEVREKEEQVPGALLHDGSENLEVEE